MLKIAWQLALCMHDPSLFSTRHSKQGIETLLLLPKHVLLGCVVLFYCGQHNLTSIQAIQATEGQHFADITFTRKTHTVHLSSVDK